jgi:hypothetical protein
MTVLGCMLSLTVLIFVVGKCLMGECLMGGFHLGECQVGECQVGEFQCVVMNTAVKATWCQDTVQLAEHV